MPLFIKVANCERSAIIPAKRLHLAVMLVLIGPLQPLQHRPVQNCNDPRFAVFRFPKFYYLTGQVDICQL